MQLVVSLFGWRVRETGLELQLGPSSLRTAIRRSTFEQGAVSDDLTSLCPSPAFFPLFTLSPP